MDLWWYLIPIGLRRLQHLQASSLRYSGLRSNLLDWNPLWERKTRLFRRQIMARWAKKGIHISSQCTRQNSIWRGTRLSVQGWLPHLVKLVALLDNFLHLLLMVEEQVLLLLGVPGLQLQLLQGPHDGLFLHSGLSSFLPTLLHTHHGRPMAQGAWWSLHMEQQLPSVRQVDDREHGSALLQLPCRLLPVVQKIRYLLLHCPLDGR